MHRLFQARCEFHLWPEQLERYRPQTMNNPFKAIGNRV
jgi:hypothetical protein